MDDSGKSVSYTHLDVYKRQALGEAAGHFRAAAAAWDALGRMLLPDQIAPFAKARTLMLERHARFLDEGNAAQPRMEAIDARLAAIRAGLADDFPLSSNEVVAHRAAIAEQVMACLLYTSRCV